MLKNNISSVTLRIKRACEQAGRDPRDVLLLAVTKTVPAETVQEALSYGITAIGENKIQEAQVKFPQLTGISAGVKKHYIGHLQTNKAKKAVELFDVIQSLDSVRLAEEINAQAGKRGKVQECLVEVKVSGEESKFGLAPADVPDFLANMRRYGNLRVTGIMGMAPYAEDPEEARPYFRKLKELFTKIRETYDSPDFRVLSMGMSGDFEIALEEGSTLVRIGTALFS